MKSVARYLLTAAVATASAPLCAQIVNTWEEGTVNNGVVTTVEQGAVEEGDFAAVGILTDWTDMLDEFNNSGASYQELEDEISSLRRGGAGTTVSRELYGPDGILYQLPQIIDEDGTDLFLLTRDGITIYSAIDAPVYLQDIDDEIVRWVRFYAYTKKAYTRKLFERYRQWEPRIKNYFASAGVPEELAELCLIESGCTYKALSKAGALGMWQIMPDTGRAYGMRIDNYVDERLDPVTSTLTAAKILTANYRRTGEWTLAAAAYNCGVGRFVNNANKGRPWSQVKATLPKETQQYIPGLIAIHYVWTYRDRLGF